MNSRYDASWLEIVFYLFFIISCSYMLKYRERQKYKSGEWQVKEEPKSFLDCWFYDK